MKLMFWVKSCLKLSASQSLMGDSSSCCNWVEVMVSSFLSKFYFLTTNSLWTLPITSFKIWKVPAQFVPEQLDPDAHPPTTGATQPPPICAAIKLRMSCWLNCAEHKPTRDEIRWKNEIENILKKLNRFKAIPSLAWRLTLRFLFELCLHNQNETQITLTII